MLTDFLGEKRGSTSDERLDEHSYRYSTELKGLDENIPPDWCRPTREGPEVAARDKR